MIYEIEMKNDMLTGSVLIVKIPEDDLDRKALYTIQEDKPGFILPFRHRAIDRQIEFVYRIGTQSKLHYLAGDRYPKEYSELWSSVLDPLLDCGDWFLKPYSFVLDMNHLYCDKNENSVRYVYIPSIRDCSDYDDLKAMVAEFSGQITVTSADLENKVLRAIMADFNPKSFMQMLKANATVSAPVECAPPAPRQHAYEPKALPMPGQKNAKPAQAGISEIYGMQSQESAADRPDEIIIDVPTKKHAEKRNKSKTNSEGASLNKKEKQANNHESASGLFKKKPEAHKDEVIETGLIPQTSAIISNPPELEQFLPIAPTEMQPYEPADITQSISYETNGTWFRLVGSAQLPAGIDVAIAEGEVFTVGRYDIAAGRKLSSFEFDRMTKAISRRHAAIERLSDGYNIIDLASSAGTYIDGQKLPPNTPCKLQAGCRVSFGNCGAEYVWEQ